MSVRMRHTRAHTANRRSHHALVEARLSKCIKCGAAHLRHRMCMKCGTYRGKEIIDMNAKIEKKMTKKKEKMKRMGEGEQKEVKDTPKKLDAEALSDK